MTKVDIDLAEKSPCCEPEPLEKEVYYPSLHISGTEELDLPSSGVMLVKFKKTSSSESEHRGKKSYSCTLEVHRIIAVNGKSEDEDYEEMDKSPGRKTEDALDAIASALKSQKK